MPGESGGTLALGEVLAGGMYADRTGGQILVGPREQTLGVNRNGLHLLWANVDCQHSLLWTLTSFHGFVERSEWPYA